MSVRWLADVPPVGSDPDVSETVAVLACLGAILLVAAIAMYLVLKVLRRR